MNKHLIIIGIVVLFICVGLSGCIDEKQEETLQEETVEGVINEWISNDIVELFVEPPIYPDKIESHKFGYYGSKFGEYVYPEENHKFIQFCVILKNIGYDWVSESPGLSEDNQVRLLDSEGYSVKTKCFTEGTYDIHLRRGEQSDMCFVFEVPQYVDPVTLFFRYAVSEEKYNHIVNSKTILVNLRMAT